MTIAQEARMRGYLPLVTGEKISFRSAQKLTLVDDRYFLIPPSKDDEAWVRDNLQALREFCASEIAAKRDLRGGWASSFEKLVLDSLIVDVRPIRPGHQELWSCLCALSSAGETSWQHYDEYLSKSGTRAKDHAQVTAWKMDGFQVIEGGELYRAASEIFSEGK